MKISELPESFLQLLTSKSFASLATVMPDGTPQVTPTWVDRDGDMVLVNSAKGRVKDRNLRANSKVGLSVSDPDNAYRYLSVQGEVVEFREEGADAHIDALAKRYMGVDSYPYRTAEEVRVIYVIRPTAVHTFGE